MKKSTSNDLEMTFENVFQNIFATSEWIYQILHIATH
jgi:hypothetical protein